MGVKICGLARIRSKRILRKFSDTQFNGTWPTGENWEWETNQIQLAMKKKLERRAKACGTQVAPETSYLWTD